MAVGGTAVITRRLLERTGFSFQVSGWGWGERVDDFFLSSHILARLTNGFAVEQGCIQISTRQRPAWAGSCSFSVSVSMFVKW